MTTLGCKLYILLQQVSLDFLSRQWYVNYDGVQFKMPVQTAQTRTAMLSHAINNRDGWLGAYFANAEVTYTRVWFTPGTIHPASKKKKKKKREPRQDS